MRWLIAPVLLTLGSGSVGAPAEVVFSARAAPVDPAVFGGSGGHALWFRGLNDGDRDHQVRLVFEPDAFLSFNGTTAHLAGTATVSELGGGPGTLGERWLVSADFVFRGQGDDGVGHGGPKLELDAHDADAVARWLYFDFGEATLHNDAGDEVVLHQRPSNGAFPFQLGFGASGKNADLGASGWFSFERISRDGSSYSGHGDFNIDLETLSAFAAASPAL